MPAHPTVIVTSCHHRAGQGEVVGKLDRSWELARTLTACRLPVVLVVGMRLGCLNHARLTAAAITAEGCELVGWIASGVDPDMACREENLALLDARLGVPRLGDLPPVRDPDRGR